MLEISVPKRRRDKEGTKRKLLDAALEVFSTRGYENATTREIAARAGVSESLIQRYYDSKAGLLLALFGHFKDRMKENATELTREAAQRPDLRSGMQQAMMRYVQTEAEHRDFMRVMVPRSIIDETAAKDIANMVHGDLVGPIDKLLQSWQSEGKLRTDLPTGDLALIFYAMTFSLGFMNQVVLSFPDDRVMRLVALAAQCLVEGISV